MGERTPPAWARAADGNQALQDLCRGRTAGTAAHVGSRDRWWTQLAGLRAVRGDAAEPAAGPGENGPDRPGQSTDRHARGPPAGGGRGKAWRPHDADDDRSLEPIHRNLAEPPCGHGPPLRRRRMIALVTVQAIAGGHMADIQSDESVLGRIKKLVDEEHALRSGSDLDRDGHARLE